MATTQERATTKERTSRLPEYETEAAELIGMLERMPERVFLVDIQDPETFDAGHIPGSRNIHLEDLVSSCAGLPRDRTIVIYCGEVNCGLPYWAAMELAQAGFRTKHLQGGLAEWRRNGYPIDSTPPPAAAGILRNGEGPSSREASMEFGIFGPKEHAKSPAIGAVEYLKAKLDYEASPYGLNQTLETAPGKVMIVDVRDPDAFRREHILGAVNIPAADIVKRLADLPRDRTIVAYCWDVTCALAPKAALELAQKGFKVQFLAGGIEEWKKGFTVKRSAA